MDEIKEKLADLDPEIVAQVIFGIGLELVTVRYAKKHFGKEGARLVRLLWASEAARRTLREKLK